MSYTPVPAGGIEPPHDGATTRCLPTWLSRRKLVAEAGIEPAADEAYETPALPTELFRALRHVAAPLGFEPSRPGSKPGALPARRRGHGVVPRAGFEPALPDLKDRCPRPFRRTWQCWSGRRELNSRPLLGRQRLYRLSYARVADGAGVEPARPEGLDALAPRCLTARPTIRNSGIPWRPRSESNTRPAV